MLHGLFLAPSQPAVKRGESHLPQFPHAWKVVCLLISEISFPAVDLLYVSAGSRGGTNKNTYMLSSGALFGAVSSVLLLLELNKKIVRKLSLHVIITEFQK